MSSCRESAESTTPHPLGEEEEGNERKVKKSVLLKPAYMGSSESSLSLCSCSEERVNTGQVGETGEEGGEGDEGEEGEEVEGSCETPSSPLVLPGEEEGAPSPPGTPLKEDAFPLKSSLDSLLTSSPSSLRLPSPPHRSLSRVGEEGVDGGSWCFLDFLLVSLKLARGGRSLTPLRVEPSIAFCSCWRENVSTLDNQIIFFKYNPPLLETLFI